MKRHFYTIGSVIVLLFAAFIFVILPAMVGKTAGKKLPPFGSYDGKNILYEQGTPFAKAVSNYAEMLKMQGQEINENAYFYIFNYAFNSTVTKMAYDSAVEKSGWRVPETAISRNMLPYFYDETGKYSSKLFRQADENRKREIYANVKESLISQRYYDDAFGSEETVGKEALFGLKSSSKEIPFIRSMGEKTRSFDAALFNTDNYPDEMSASYGKEHSGLFVTYDLSVITVSDESTAKTILNRLNSNEIIFTDAVTEYSSKNYSGDDGKLRDKYSYQIKNIISKDEDFKAVCALETGKTSAIVKTGTGYSIFKADSDAVQPDFTKSETVNDVHKYLNAYEKGIIEDYFTEIAKNFASDAVQNGFDKACKTFDTQKVEIPAIALNYGNLAILGTLPLRSAQEFADAPNDENFLKEIFSLKQNEISDPLVLGKNVAVLQMKEEIDGGTDEATASQTFPAEIAGFDREAAQAALFNSPKVVNNVMSVFFNNFMNNN
ncbi:peptidylprolyl isomerase [Treponema parvum]|uniref:Peptidylprolyl isomerase n=1 Tax=Treponema parvum TaxID=138851 RepID=A0A975EYZ0_9SPIR|nr:peptidylprolyl isomerase [Treponema parvum]QTQ11501.1 peptidylprolyl isomerase [Treponema parvum]QTQ16551.1 peptidylprolyl isomerase [Treponema parvum]